MPAPQPQNSNDTPDPNALAGSPNSLGEESRRDGRPTTDDNVVEAIDEEGPEIPRPGPRKSDQ
jgi:hypothetical protein